MVPPRVPQFNWVDLGLPSGTLWLDRPLGAKSVGDPGLMYQWGALKGYMSTSQFSFSLANYEEQGLNLITGDLTLEHDAAAMYYGGIAQIPSLDQLKELAQNTTVTKSGDMYELRSNINGNVIRILARGEFVNQSVQISGLILWSNKYSDETHSRSLRIYSDSTSENVNTLRYAGLLILPVKTS